MESRKTAETCGLDPEPGGLDPEPGRLDPEPGGLDPEPGGLDDVGREGDEGGLDRRSGRDGSTAGFARPGVNN